MSRLSGSDGIFFCSLAANFPVGKHRSLMFFQSTLSLLTGLYFPSAPPATFEDGADVFPDGDAAAAVELAQSQLHVEERDASEHSHQQVGQQKGTWAESTRGGMKVEGE